MDSFRTLVGLKSLCIIEKSRGPYYQDILRVRASPDKTFLDQNHLQLIMERYNFYRRIQQEGETDVKYVAKLQKLAE